MRPNDVKRKIKAVQNIQKITKAMKSVAAVKARKAEERVRKVKDYSREMFELTKRLSTEIAGFQHPLLEKREIKTVGILVVTSDRGLCGSFNANILREGLKLYNKYKAEGKEVRLFAVGRKAKQFFERRFPVVIASFTKLPQPPTQAEASLIASEITKYFSDGTIDALKVLYYNYKSMAKYSIVEEDVLPLLNMQEKNEPKATYIFEPEEDVVASYLLERGLMAEILRVILETAASEQAARMAAMSQASENAQDLIKQLTLAFNKARQAIITRELSEIIGTTTALGS